MKKCARKNFQQQKINALSIKCEEYEKEIAVLRENADSVTSRKMSRTASTASVPVEADKVMPMPHVSITAAQVSDYKNV